MAPEKQPTPSGNSSAEPDAPSLQGPGQTPASDACSVHSSTSSTITRQKADAFKNFLSSKPTTGKRSSFFQSFIKGKQPVPEHNSNPVASSSKVSPNRTDGATGQTTETGITRGQKATVKTLEERYNNKGYCVIREPGFFFFTSPDLYKKPSTVRPLDEKYAQYALCVIRHFDRNQIYTTSTLEIKSEYIKKSLGEIIKNYPGVSFLTQVVRLEYPLRCLYHYFDEIVEDLRKRKGEWKDHMELLVDFCKDEFKDTVMEARSLLPEGLVSNEILWTIFKPGEIFLTSLHGHLRALKLVEFIDNMCTWCLQGEYIDYNGKKFYKQTVSVYLRKFAGVEKITDLPAYPLKYHPKAGEIRARLLLRGRKFESMQCRHYMEYDGVGMVPSNPTIRGTATAVDLVIIPTKYNISGRVMVDAETYYRLNPDRVVKTADNTSVNQTDDSQTEMERRQKELKFGCGMYQPDENQDQATAGDNLKETITKLTDEQAIISTSTVPGFSFSEKTWVEFALDNLSEIQWNKDAFASLVLSPDQKSLIKALVESHTKEQELTTKHRMSQNSSKVVAANGEVVVFDDFVRGKGRGLISILHGPPGVGKTLTAESVAEFVQRPLYSVSSGELGTTPAEVEKSLSKILDVAKVWNAVLLLDEADVFLEQRSSNDVVRNALVSVFLRMLEYYQGILFLTSNRVGTFDEAFQSRMHVAIRYPLLDYNARREVWVNFMKMVDGGECIELSEADLNELAEIELNGRQIKNAVKTAKSLADSEWVGNDERDKKGKAKVTKRHLLVVLKLMKEFEEDFMKGGNSFATGRKVVRN